MMGDIIFFVVGIILFHRNDVAKNKPTVLPLFKRFEFLLLAFTKSFTA